MPWYPGQEVWLRVCGHVTVPATVVQWADGQVEVAWWPEEAGLPTDGLRRVQWWPEERVTPKRLSDVPPAR